MSRRTGVPSMNGAPRMAPTPISSESAVFVKRIATTGIKVSGVAVPSAARMLPVAPSLIRSFRPSHSTPFVKTSAPTRIRTNAPTISAMSQAVMAPETLRVGVGWRHRGAPPARADRAHERDEHENDGGEDQHRREAAVEKIQRAAVTGDECLAELPLGGVSEDERDHERCQRVLHLAEPIADQPEDHRDEDVEDAVVQGVRTDDRDDHDERRDDRVGHPHDHGEERHREQAEDEGQEVPQIDARDEPPDKVRMLDEEHRAGLESPDEKARHDHRGGRRAGYPERDHRNERSHAGGVRRRLGSHDPGDLALSEILLVARVLTREAVAEEGRGGRAVARQNAKEEADDRVRQDEAKPFTQLADRLEDVGQAEPRGDVLDVADSLLFGRGEDLSDPE